MSIVSYKFDPFCGKLDRIDGSHIIFLDGGGGASEIRDFLSFRFRELTTKIVLRTSDHYFCHHVFLQ